MMHVFIFDQYWLKMLSFYFLKYNQQYKELWSEFNNINNRPLGPIMAKSVLDGLENLLNVHWTKKLAQMLLKQNIECISNIPL